MIKETVCLSISGERRGVRGRPQPRPQQASRDRVSPAGLGAPGGCRPSEATQELAGDLGLGWTPILSMLSDNVRPTAQ